MQVYKTSLTYCRVNCLAVFLPTIFSLLYTYLRSRSHLHLFLMYLSRTLTCASLVLINTIKASLVKPIYLQKQIFSVTRKTINSNSKTWRKERVKPVFYENRSTPVLLKGTKKNNNLAAFKIRKMLRKPKAKRSRRKLINYFLLERNKMQCTLR